ncbi:ribosome small subunit-dependent GTPase A [Virgibacillus dakarensis]|nr:ribosome small subunit-dependent GTPase A [Virgibacillus dakarensis]
MANGRIIKALSGFYYVQTQDGIYQCRGRGVFRNKKITPLVGDFVSFDVGNPDEGYIQEIKPRENELKRPPIANIDQAIIVSSAVMPDFNPLLLDRFLALIEAKGIKPVIFITKMDAVDENERIEMQRYQRDYQQIGYPVELLSAKQPDDLGRLEVYFPGKVTVIAGQSGVGKSSLINALKPSLLLKTADISKSLGRGKHTTRHVELINVHDGLVADTPGFSSLDFSEIDLAELADCFPEFRVRKENCKFRGCMHYREPKCAVKQAVETGEITRFRYEHYLNFYEEINSRKARY